MSNSDIIEFGQNDARYPQLLSHIPDAPRTLYCRGNIDLLQSPCFAVVGTRKLTAYGREAAQDMTTGLVRGGFTIVSGLAIGIDSVAHRAAIDAGGTTVAVLGSGADEKSIYPRTNAGLAREIIEHNGVVISEYPPGTEGYKSNFPERNRIISGLSKGVLIVEADEKSGSLITARCAAEQGREVFAVPGSIFSATSRGTHQLIQKGAKLVASPHDIMEEYEGFQMPEETARTYGRNPAEQAIIAVLSTGEIMFVDDIMRAASLDSGRTLATLTILELYGAIKNLGNGKYRKI